MSDLAAGPRPTPNPTLAGRQPYRVPRADAKLDLYLDGNEGMGPDPSLLRALSDADAQLLRRYPKATALEARLAERLGVDPRQLLVTNGADDALDRACRALVGPGRALLLPVPTFEMLARYAELSGGRVDRIPWPRGPWPLDLALDALRPDTSAVAVVTPNNPTGAVASAQVLDTLSRRAPGAALLVDLAYGEFADEDLTAAALALPNALVFRTLSKAWGLAGLRVGYVAGPTEMIDWLRVAGNPYAVSGPSLLLAERRLADGDAAMRAFVATVRTEREQLAAHLSALGAQPLPSQANFVLARVADSVALRDGMAALGIAIRAWPGRADLARLVRITCPGDARDFDRLCCALQEVLAP